MTDTTLNALIDQSQERIARHFTRHAVGVLQFSGGKDSLACLSLLKPWLDRVIVIWANPGDPYPETIEQMATIKESVPNFYEIRGNAAYEQVALGWPVDTLPQCASSLGHLSEPDIPKPHLRLRYECCDSNFWAPMHRAIKSCGASLVFRGQRNDERLRLAHLTDGYVEGGITYALPLAEWTATDVFGYLATAGVDLPRQYQYGMPSLDCQLCTAYLHENEGKYAYLRKFHPQKALEFGRRIVAIKAIQERELGYLNRVLLGAHEL